LIMAIDRNLKFKPNYAVVPGLTISEMIDHLGMSQVDLAERTGRPLKTINNIIQGKQAITFEKNYRESLARTEENKKLESELNWLDEIPVRHIIANEWIKQIPSPVEQLQEVLAFFGVASPKELSVSCPDVVFRQSKKIKSDPWAICAWLRMGELQAQAVPCQPYDKSKFKEALSEIRKMTRKSVPDILDNWKKLCADSGVALVIIKELPNLKVNGATKWLKDKAVIQLSLLYKFVDILWFSFFHEAAHIILHGKKDVFIENAKLKTDSEAEADQFAEDFLIPRVEYNSFVNRGLLDRASVSKFAEDLEIAPGIVVGRLQHDNKLDYNQLNDLKPRLCWR